MTSPSGSTTDEAKQFLDAHPEIEAFDIVLTDANGVGRGKIIRRHELLGLYEAGRHLPISILGLDITGEDVHETGLIWDSGDGDLRAWPISGTLKPLHGTSPARGQVLMSMYALDGAPMTSDPRHALARQVDAFAAKGLFPAGAFELEFFLLANERDAEGRVQPATAVLDGRKSGKTEVYSVDHLHGMEPLFSDIYAAARLQGIPAETVISEYAPGQYELTLNYRKNVMQAADDLVMLKRLVRAQARRHGVTACFMAKPIERYAGSGMHLHVSLQDAERQECLRRGARRKLVAEPASCARRPLVDHGGIDAGLRAARQFLAALRVAVLRAGGADLGRQQPFRGPARYRQATRPPAGSSTVPRASTPTPISWRRPCLPASPRGWTKRSIPGPETTGNGYEAPTGAASAMPPDWRSAIEAAKASEFLKQALGEDMHRTFTAIKHAEYLRVARTVSELDYHLYLHEV